MTRIEPIYTDLILEFSRIQINVKSNKVLP